MASSVLRTLQSNVVGMPFSGADVCGTFGATVDPELCTRWHFVAAFYPFTRNHQATGAAPREPFRFADLMPDPHSNYSYMDHMRDAIRLKYSLMPYFQTEFNLISIHGGSFFNPVFFEFPHDEKAFGDVVNNFMLGRSLKVSIQASDSTMTATDFYFPDEPSASGKPTTWCNLFNKTDRCFQGGSTRTYSSQFNDYNVHIRSGSIVPLQDAWKLNVSSTEDLQASPVDLHINPYCTNPGMTDQ